MFRVFSFYLPVKLYIKNFIIIIIMSGWHIVWIGVFTGTIQQLNLGEEKASDIVFRKKTFQKKDNLTSVKFNIVKIQMLWILALKSFKENNEVEKNQTQIFVPSLVLRKPER